jgi:hypothetical protein
VMYRNTATPPRFDEDRAHPRSLRGRWDSPQARLKVLPNRRKLSPVAATLAPYSSLNGGQVG